MEEETLEKGRDAAAGEAGREGRLGAGPGGGGGQGRALQETGGDHALDAGEGGRDVEHGRRDAAAGS